MTRRFVSVFRQVCALSLLALPACQTGSTNVSVRVEPETAELAPLTSRSFEAHVSGTSDRRVTWSVVGLGSISSDGVYTAPGVIPPDSQNLIRVIATSVTGKTAEATLRMIAAPLEPTRGPTEGGTIVRITGEGFVTGTQVSFGGVAVPVEDMSIESSVLLRVRTPGRDQLGPADLVITVPGADPVVYPEAFHYGATRIQMEGATVLSTCYNDLGDYVVGDLTGDGKPDLAFACYDGGVQVYAGDGTGEFQQAYGAAFDVMTDYPYSIESGDLEGDGDLDLFVVGNVAAYVYRNDGLSLTFVQAVPWNGPTSGYYISLALADLTGDGRVDLAYNDYANDRIVVKINDGTGTFGPPAFIATQNSPYDLVAAKVDGDNDIDLVASYYSTLPSGVLGGIMVLKNAGAGTFTAASFPVRNSIYRVGVGDFDDDGDNDVLVIPASLPPAWIMNDGGGAFATITDLTHLGNHYHPTSLAGVGDLDGDGVTDAFVQFTHVNQVQVFYGAVGTGLAGAVGYDTTSEPFKISAADVTGDGVAELVSASWEVTEVYKGQGTRQFGPPKVVLGATPSHVGLLPKTGGTAVAVVAHPTGGVSLGAVSFVEVASMLSATPVVTKIDLPATSSVERVHAADVTGDGLQDVLAVDSGTNNGGNGSVWLLRGADGGTFEAAVRVVDVDPAMREVSDIAYADLDGDTHIDLVVARHDGTYIESSLGGVQVLWGNSAGGFDPPITGWMGVSPTRLEISDLDDDGIKEIVVLDNVAKRLVVLSVASRNVVETAELDVGEAPSEILIADFDRDYIKDIAVLARYEIAYSIEIDVFHGLGYQTWDVPERYRFYGYGFGMVYGDIDGDGLEDLAVPVDYPASVAVLRGHDNGRFLDPELALVPGYPVGVSLADIDGDSLIDLIVADQNSTALRPLANRSR
jgi:hypothetical protein